MNIDTTQRRILQRLRKDYGETFNEVERAISQVFIPALFDDELDDDDPRHQLTCLPVKHAGLAMPDATLSAKSNYDTNTLIHGHYLYQALIGATTFLSSDHVYTIREANVT